MLKVPLQENDAHDATSFSNCSSKPSKVTVKLITVTCGVCKNKRNHMVKHPVHYDIQKRIPMACKGQVPFLYPKLAPNTSMWHFGSALYESSFYGPCRQPTVGSNTSLDANFREVMWIWHLGCHIKEEVLVVVHLPHFGCEANTFQLRLQGIYSTC